MNENNRPDSAPDEIPDFNWYDFMETDKPYKFLYEQSGNVSELRFAQILTQLSERAEQVEVHGFSKLYQAYLRDMMNRKPDTEQAESAAGGWTFYITGKGMAALAAVELFSVGNSSLDPETKRRILARYCEYIAAHGYEGGAEAALAEIDALTDKDSAEAWICDTYSRYVTDDNALLDALKEAVTP